MRAFDRRGINVCVYQLFLLYGWFVLLFVDNTDLVTGSASFMLFNVNVTKVGSPIQQYIGHRNFDSFVMLMANLPRPSNKCPWQEHCLCQKVVVYCGDDCALQFLLLLTECL